MQRLVKIIEDLECSPYFLDHLTKSQKEQKTIVAAFQKELYQELFIGFGGVSWYREMTPSEISGDSVDIYAECDDYVIAIELDKHRADQVAKKFVSRMAIMPTKKIYYISLCYPGTKSMSKPECIKYFGYCNNLAERMKNNIWVSLLNPKHNKTSKTAVLPHSSDFLKEAKSHVYKFRPLK